MQKIICPTGTGVQQCMFELCHVMGNGVEEPARLGKIKIVPSRLQKTCNKILRKMVADNPDLSRSSAPSPPLPSAFSFLLPPMTSHLIFYSRSLSYCLQLVKL
jgi:hypothetical protein